VILLPMMNRMQKWTAFTALMTARLAAKGTSAPFFKSVMVTSALSSGSHHSRNSSG